MLLYIYIFGCTQNIVDVIMKHVGILSKIHFVFAAMGTQLLLCFVALLVSGECSFFNLSGFPFSDSNLITMFESISKLDLLVL